MALGVAETLKEKVSASETVETEFQGFRLTRNCLDRASPAKRGQNKTQVIWLVWNAKPGGSKSFKDASASV